jgi:hypothetical protein
LRQDGAEKRPSGADWAAGSIGVIALVAGVVLLLAAGGDNVWIAGVVLLGLAGIAFVALVFLLVGESEDSEREKGTL